MYQYLDRPIADLAADDRMLLAAMRHWVAARRLGQCPSVRIEPIFRARAAQDAVQDFFAVMAGLDCDGIARLCFHMPDCPCVGDDEARILSLFDAGRDAAPSQRARRIAAGLVREEAIAAVAGATRFLSANLAATRYGSRP